MSGIRNFRVLILAALLLTGIVFLVSTNDRLSTSIVPQTPPRSQEILGQSKVQVVTQLPPVTEERVVYETKTEVQERVVTKTETAVARETVVGEAAGETKKGKVLVVLPKDKRTKGDFGFRDGGWLEAAMENRQEYADAHGYEFVWQDLSTFQPEYGIDACWAKIAALQDAYLRYPDVEWIWMLDADAIIMNANIDLYEHLLSPETLKKVVAPDQEIKIPGGPKIDEQNKVVRTRKEVVPEEIEFIIAKDGNGINAGSFFVKRTAFMSGVVDFWKDPYLMKASFGYREQDALGHLMLFHEQFLKRVAIVPQKLINEYVDRLKEGDFVVHFAGCSFYKDRDCDALFREKWDERTRAKSALEAKPAQSLAQPTPAAEGN